MFTLPTEEHKCTGDILCLHCLQRNITVLVICLPCCKNIGQFDLITNCIKKLGRI